jgi:uncharacterized protein YjdB
MSPTIILPAARSGAPSRRAPAWLERARAAWRRLRVAPALGAFLLLLAVACGDTTDPVPVASVALDPAQRALTVGETQAFTATPRDAEGRPLTGRAIAWQSSAPAVATVTAAGRVTAVGPGSATVSATSEGKTARSVVTVTPVPVSSVDVSPRRVVLAPGEAIPVSATPRDAEGRALSGRAVRWVSTDPAVATVSGSGRVTAVAAGSATISATSEGVSGLAEVTVQAAGPAPVARIEVTPTAVVLDQGTARQLTAVVRDAAGNVLTDRVVTWTTDNAPVAVVSAAGRVTAVAPGYATIVAASEGKTFGVAVTVGPAPVARVDVSPNPASVAVGGTLQLTARPRGAGGAPLDRPVTWASADERLATVDASGRVTGRRAGMVEITATSEGITGGVAVWVYPVQHFKLARVGDAPLPHTLFTTTEVGGDGVVRTVRWDAHEGYFRLIGFNGFEQAINFWIHREGSVPTQVAYVYTGSFEYDVTTPGGLIFRPNGRPEEFRGRLLPDGTLTVTRRLEPNTPVLTFVHRAP